MTETVYAEIRRLTALEKAVWFPPVFFLFLVGSAVVTARLGRAHENLLFYASLQIAVGLLALGVWKLIVSVFQWGPVVSCSINGLFVATLITEWNHNVFSISWTTSGPQWLGLITGALVGIGWSWLARNSTGGRMKDFG